MQTLDTDLARQVSERDPSLERLERLEYVATIADPVVSEADDPGSFRFDRLAEVNKDLWLILAMLTIAALANHLLVAQRLVLGFYTLPTIFAAFYRGRRHATLTAAASALLVGLMSYLDPDFWSGNNLDFYNARLYDLATWGLMLMLTAYCMGTLHERFSRRSQELRQTYHGLLMILRQFINQDKDTANHSYRVSVHAVTIADHLKLKTDRIELVRAAALLHDLGKLDTSRDVLHKAAEITQAEREKLGDRGGRSMEKLEPVAVSMGRVLPIILAHHDRYDGGGYRRIESDDIPLEARIIAVADVYDALTSDRDDGQTMAPAEARETIRRGAGTEFDPEVVTAFLRAHDRGMMEAPEIYA